MGKDMKYGMIMVVSHFDLVKKTLSLQQVLCRLAAL